MKSKIRIVVFTLLASAAHADMLGGLDFKVWGTADISRKAGLYQGWANGFISGEITGAELEFTTTPVGSPALRAAHTRLVQGGLDLMSCLGDMSPTLATVMIDRYYRNHPEGWSKPLSDEFLRALTVEGGACAGKNIWLKEEGPGDKDRVAPIGPDGNHPVFQDFKVWEESVFRSDGDMTPADASRKRNLYQGWRNGFLTGNLGGVLDEAIEAQLGATPEVQTYTHAPFELGKCLDTLSPDQAVAMIDRYYRSHPGSHSAPLSAGLVLALTEGGACEGKNSWFKVELEPHSK
jgi:hypothetical protein